MTIPFEPEPIEQLRARLKHALAKVWDIDAIVANTSAGQIPDRPGKYREHVFDFSVGQNHLRVILSIDRCTCHGCRLHVSASTPGGVPADERVRDFLRQIGVGGVDPVDRCASPEGVLHLYFPWDGAPVFNGELMTCILCGRRGRSSPGEVSGWGAFLFDDLGRVYACPAEVPSPLASPAAVGRFWERLRRAVDEHRAGPITMPTLGRSQADCRRPGVN